MVETEGKTVGVEVIERIVEHYEIKDVQYSGVYKWCPELVVVQCACGKRATYKRADFIGFVVTACECGDDVMVRSWQEMVTEPLDEDCEAKHHPWRYWHTFAYEEVP